MHLYLNYIGQILTIVDGKTLSLEDVGRAIYDLEQKYQRRLPITVVYTEIESNDEVLRYSSVKKAFEYLDTLVAKTSEAEKETIEHLQSSLKEIGLSYKRYSSSSSSVYIRLTLVNLLHSFEVMIEDDQSLSVLHQCEELGVIEELHFQHVDSFIERLKYLQTVNRNAKEAVMFSSIELWSDNRGDY